MKTKVDYRVVMQSGCDFAVEKNMGRGRKKELLVVLVSQKSYYLKKTNEPPVALDARGLYEFMKHMRDLQLPLPEVSWLDGLVNDSMFRSKLLEVIWNDTFVAMARKNSIYMYEFGGADLCGCQVAAWNMKKCGLREFSEQCDMGKMFVSQTLMELFPGNDHSAGYPPDSWKTAHFLDYHRVSAQIDPQHNYFASDKMEQIQRILESFYEKAPGFYLWLVEEMSRRRGITKKELFQSLEQVYNPFLEAGFEMEQDTTKETPMEREIRLFQSFDSLLLLAAAFGEEWGREAVKQYYDYGMESVLSFVPLYQVLYGKPSDATPKKLEDYKKLKPIRKYQAKLFLNYLFHEGAEAGFRENLEEYLMLWDQVLSMQMDLYGKIRDKYPSNLVSYCYRISEYLKKNEDQVKRNQWRNAVEQMKPYEYRNEKYQILCPKSEDEVRDEAAQQSNCLVSFGYIERIREQSSQVFFMRKVAKGQENQSLITIEVQRNRIVQACRKYNDRPGKGQMDFIREWAREKGLKTEDDDPIDPYDDWELY